MQLHLFDCYLSAVVVPTNKSSILPEWQFTTSTTSSLSWQLPELQLLRTAIQPFCAHSSRKCTLAIKPSSPAGPWLRCVGWVLISSLDTDSEGASHSRIIHSTILSPTLQQNSSLEFGNLRCTQDVFSKTYHCVTPNSTCYLGREHPATVPQLRTNRL